MPDCLPLRRDLALFTLWSSASVLRSFLFAFHTGAQMGGFHTRRWQDDVVLPRAAMPVTSEADRCSHPWRNALPHQPQLGWALVAAHTQLFINDHTGYL